MYNTSICGENRLFVAHKSWTASSSFGGIIVKKFLSLTIALMLLVSSFAFTAVAFAAGDGETAARTLTYNKAAFIDAMERLDPDNLLYKFEMSETFMLSNNWLKDEELVKTIFGDQIRYHLLPDENENIEDQEEEFTLTYVYGEEADKKSPSPEKHKESQHITLPKALKAKSVKAADTDGEQEGDGEGDVFVPEFLGWIVSYTVDQQPQVVENYRAEDKFAMPAADVTVTAKWSSEDDDEFEFTYPVNDVIYVLYTEPTDGTKNDDDWNNCPVTDTLRMQDVGEWWFKYVVVDGEKASQSGYKFDKDDILPMIDSEGKEALPFVFQRYTADTLNPVVEISDSMQEKQKAGLVAGKGTQIGSSSCLVITDNSNAVTTTTFKVYKKVGNVEGAVGGWLLVYDSETKDVTKGYENCISNDGVNCTITPLQTDVSTEPVYRVVFTVKDNEGFFGVAKEGDTEEYNPTLEFSVKLSDDDAKGKAKVEAWKIVLFVIAGLSAAGIVVVLCIKPKQTVKADARYNSTGDADATEDKEE